LAIIDYSPADPSATRILPVRTRVRSGFLFSASIKCG
jgi:hypothetical protein